MKIEIRADGAVHIEGYVNAVGRDSRPLPSARGKFVEQVSPGAFDRACRACKPVLMHNHRRTLDADAEFFEDNIGLHVSADIRDSEIADKARNKELRGWSFGFNVNAGGDSWDDTAQPYPRRTLTDIAVPEVSIIDSSMTPCYVGTSVEVRGEAEITTETRASEDDAVELVDTASKIKNEHAIMRKKFEILKEKTKI